MLQHLYVLSIYFIDVESFLSKKNCPIVMDASADNLHKKMVGLVAT